MTDGKLSLRNRVSLRYLHSAERETITVMTEAEFNEFMEHYGNRGAQVDGGGEERVGSYESGGGGSSRGASDDGSPSDVHEAS